MSKTDSERQCMVLDGEEVGFTPGETVLQIAVKVKATRRSPRGTVFASFSFSDVPVKKPVTNE